MGTWEVAVHVENASALRETQACVRACAWHRPGGGGGGGQGEGGDASMRSCVCARAFVCVHLFALDMLHASTPPNASAELQGIYTGPMGLPHGMMRSQQVAIVSPFEADQGADAASLSGKPTDPSLITKYIFGMFECLNV